MSRYVKNTVFHGMTIIYPGLKVHKNIKKISNCITNYQQSDSLGKLSITIARWDNERTLQLKGQNHLTQHRELGLVVSKSTQYSKM